ncbi:MAG: DUF2147 domain-containing protein [Prevotellaceae bacterium]|jgi:uncharacterized protein (DUF2147 family)|nr:DUF2147 domain-containing protein [Prevotellaceae bacterium]
MRKLVLFFAFCLTATFVNAQVDKIVGNWITIDDNTGTQKSVVQIFKATNGKYYGKIVELLVQEDKGSLCDLCTGADKNKPVEGLMIIKNLTEDGGKLVGGTIIDPENGKTYNVKILLDEKTGKLKLRGSLDKAGVLGRTQYWVRKK